MSYRFIIIIAMVIVGLLAGFFLTWPEYQKFQQLQAESKQKKAELDSKAGYYSAFMNTWDKLEEYQDSLSQIEGAVANGYSLPALFNYLKQITGETGLVLEDLTFGGVSGEAIKEISFNLEVSGAYSALKNFLAALENSTRFFSVKNISFSAPAKGQTFSFKVTVTTYSY